MNKNRFISIASAVIGVLLMATSCEKEKTYESTLPKFDHVSVSPSTALPGETVKGTIYFSYTGSYIKGTYQWDLTNSEHKRIVAGEVSTGAVKEQSFSIPIPDNAEEGTYTLTVSPRMMAAFAGDAPYIDYSSMGNVKTQLDRKSVV